MQALPSPSRTRRGAVPLRTLPLLLLAAQLLAAGGTRAGERPPPGGHRVIEWSGFRWRVKDSAGERVGPGHNYFSSDPVRSVFVDPQGRLHLRIARTRDPQGATRWTCAEVFTERSLGHGTYRWQIDTPIPASPRMVLGLFTWDDTSEAENHREIDVELISTWGQTNTLLNAQFVLQPFETRGHLHRFAVPATPEAANTTHAFAWLPDRIDFVSFTGHGREPRNAGALLRKWTYRGEGIPHPGREQVRINLWLLKPLDETDAEPEVILSRFAFEPAKPR
jgi:hypothetical protein